MIYMLVLGIDPGTATTGYGLIELKQNKDLQVVKYGLIETSKESIFAKRLYNIHYQLSEIIQTYNPQIMAMEKVFFATNRKTAIRVGQAQGVILLAAGSIGLPVVEYAPGTIKKIVVGNGRASKEEMQTAVRTYLGNGVRKVKGKKTHFDNEADALAVAICHLINKNGNTFKM